MTVQPTLWCIIQYWFLLWQSFHSDSGNLGKENQQEIFVSYMESASSFFSSLFLLLLKRFTVDFPGSHVAQNLIHVSWNKKSSCPFFYLLFCTHRRFLNLRNFITQWCRLPTTTWRQRNWLCGQNYNLFESWL